MAKPKKKVSSNPLADIAAGNLDRAAAEIEGTIAALSNLTSTTSGNASAILRRALRHIAEARELAIETFERDF